MVSSVGSSLLRLDAQLACLDLRSTLVFVSGLVFFFLNCPVSCGAALPRAYAIDDGYLQTSWTTENGLPQNSVSTVLQTRDGHLWFGTFGGLVRFDGIEFTVFNTVNTPVLRSNRIRALYEDHEGDLWIGAEHGGATRFHQGVFTNFSTKDGLPDDSVAAITGDDTGALWVGTTRGIARFQNGRFAPYITSLPGQVSVYAIYHDHGDGVWVGTFKAGLVHLNGNAATKYTTHDGLPDDAIRSLFRDGQGRFWVGTMSGLVRLDGDRFFGVKAKDGSAIREVRSLAQDSRQTLWVGTSNGLFQVQNGELVRFSEQAPSYDSIRSLLPDREANLWIGRVYAVCRD